jgi:hypothetical protein
MAFPCEHWTQIVGTNPLEHVNHEVKRRSDGRPFGKLVEPRRFDDEGRAIIEHKGSALKKGMNGR